MNSYDEVYASLDEFEALEVSWFFKPFIPYEMVTVLEGDPGVGKSYVAMDLAARMSIGGRLPNGDEVEQGTVLYLSAEDDPSYTIRPRIEALGGDPSQIVVQDQYDALTDNGFKRLHEAIEKYEPRLIIIDPLYSFMSGDGDVVKPNVIRPFLNSLNTIAKDAGAAVVVIRHLTKMKKEKAIYQGSGSIEVIAAARSAVWVTRHPHNSDKKVFVHIKHNLSERGVSYEYLLEPPAGGGVPELKWVGESSLTADDLFDGGGQPSAKPRDVAIELLLEILKDGPVEASKIYSEAKKVEISKRTLMRAKKAVRVKSSKKGSHWYWRLPG